MTTSSQNNKRIAKNTLMLYFRMILTMLVSLYTSRVVLNVLGVEDYGTYNVVGGVVTMFGFFNGAMASATQRFLSFELGKGDFLQLKKTFNAALVIHIGIALLIALLAETVGLWFVYNYLKIPPGRMEAAIWIYHFSVLAFMVSVIQVPYNALIIARERMNVYAYVSILEVLLKLLIVFMLTWIAFDKLKLYGVLVFAVTALIALIYQIYTRKHFDETRFEVVRDKALFKTLVSYSGWNLFGNIAAVVKGQGVNIIINIFFGALVNAAQGIAGQVQSAVMSFVYNFQMAVNPQIIKSYAAAEKEYMMQLIIRSAKFSFFLLFILSLPVLLEVDIILKLWLKIVPEHAANFTVLVLIIALIDCVSGPLMTSIQATGKIKLYQSVVGILLMLILPISYLFFKLGYIPEAAYYVNIVIAIVALFARLYMARKQLQLPVLRFVKEVLMKNIIIALIAILPLLFIKNLLPEGLMRLLVMVFLSLLVSSGTIYFIGLDMAERSMVMAGINKILKRNNG